MRLRHALLASLAIRVLVYMMILFIPSLALASDKDGIPALLQFAESYQQQTSSSFTPPADPAPDKAKKIAAPPSASRLGSWKIKDTEIANQKKKIDALEQQIILLKKKSLISASATQQKPRPVLDASTLRSIVKRVRNVLSITPTEQAAQNALLEAQRKAESADKTQKALLLDNAQLKISLNELALRLKKSETDSENSAESQRLAQQAEMETLRKNNAELESHLAATLKVNETLKASSEEVNENLKESKQESQLLRKERKDGEEQIAALNQSLAMNAGKEEELRKELVKLQEKALPSLDDATLKIAKNQQDYAAGVSLGEEIMQMQAERERWGVHTNKQFILSGIADTFAGERRLPEDVLNMALTQSEQSVEAAREKVVSTQKKQGEDYLAKFNKSPQVKTGKNGVLYRIDYAGDNAIKEDAIVDVVVKETLTDGTVIQDMESNGSVLSQPIKAFNPVFREALAQLKNHGTMTLVVPPEQAYGDKGYPPKIPPNATMVYTLRIAEVYDKPATKL